jgi:tRNA/tmRNA/rRNA uracil-C5-methylase (TrmA/RlmC/RlmD family)
MSEKITLKAEKWVNDGFTLGFYNRMPIFILGAIPGETVVCNLYEVTSKYSKGSVCEVLDPSPLRREAPCDIFLSCGGCTFQHLDYTEEKIIKENLLKNDIIFNKLLDINSSILKSIPFYSEDEYGYRNNVQVKNKNGKVIEKVLNIQPKKGTLTIAEVNNLYKEIIKKTSAKDIMIKVSALDGFKTLKAYDYVEDDLSMVYDDYYSSLPKDTRDKFDNLLAVQFIIK